MLILRCGKMYACLSLTFRLLTSNIQNPLLPVTVQDQIRLWELEKNRLNSQEGTSHVLVYWSSVEQVLQAIYIQRLHLKQTMNLCLTTRKN